LLLFCELELPEPALLEAGLPELLLWLPPCTLFVLFRLPLNWFVSVPPP